MHLLNLVKISSVETNKHNISINFKKIASHKRFRNLF